MNADRPFFRHRLAILVLLFLVAFSLRLAYWERTASFGKYELSYDDDEYYNLGVNFAHGDFLTDPYPLRYTRAPGFPLFLGAIFAAFGSQIAVALFMQVGVSMLTTSLTYLVARRAFGIRAGLWAMGLMALSPLYAALAGSWVLSETLFAFFILLFLYLWWRWSFPEMSLWRAFIAGLVLGFSALVRPMALYFVVIAAGWFLYSHRARWKWALPRIALLVVGMSSLVLPYTLRNFIVYQRFLLIDSTSGWNLWRDHRVDNDGFSTALAKIPNPADRDRYAFQRGVQIILSDPVHQLGVRTVENTAALMRPELDAYARGAGYITDVNVDAPTLPLVLLGDIHFVLIVVLSIAGILLTWQRAPRLFLFWLAYALALLVLYHVLTRFRAHYAFVLILFAAAALAQGRALWSALSPRARVAWLGASVLVLALSYTPRLPPLFVAEYYLAQAIGGDSAPAQNAVRAFPTYIKAWDELGNAYRRAGDFSNAVAAYDSAIRLNEFELQARLGKLDVFRRQGSAVGIAQELALDNADRGGLDLAASDWWSFDPAPARLVELGDSASSVGYILNFGGIESNGEEKMRFTRARSFVKFPGVRTWNPAELVFYARAVPLPHQPLPSVTVYLNGRSVSQIALGTDWADYSVPLDAAARAGDPLIVEFRAPTFRPKDVLPGSRDTRELGFMMSYVELR